MGRTKLIETPEKLMEIFEEYRAYTLDNPRHKWVLAQKTAEMVAEPLRVPLTNEGFEIFCYKNYSDVTGGGWWVSPPAPYITILIILITDILNLRQSVRT
jgi:hypothetical protein